MRFQHLRKTLRSGFQNPGKPSRGEVSFVNLLFHGQTQMCWKPFKIIIGFQYGGRKKDVLELCPRSFDVFLQVGFVVENPKPKQQVEQGLNMDRINEINDWFWNPV